MEVFLISMHSPCIVRLILMILNLERNLMTKLGLMGSFCSLLISWKNCPASRPVEERKVVVPVTTDAEPAVFGMV